MEIIILYFPPEQSSHFGQYRISPKMGQLGPHKLHFFKVWIKTYILVVQCFGCSVFSCCSVFVPATHLVSCSSYIATHSKNLTSAQMRVCHQLRSPTPQLPLVSDRMVAFFVAILSWLNCVTLVPPTVV